MTDAAQRAAALDPTQSFIVQAPAGSGKTELLTQRFLKLLSCVQSPEEILAVTFTRKAAAEMRIRIIDALQKANLPRPLDKAHEQITFDLAHDVLKRDRQLHWQLQLNPNRLRIVTIDALCAYIVNRLPILSHLGGMPEIIDYPESYYQKAVDLLLQQTTQEESWASSLSRLLIHLDNRIEMIRELFVTLLGKRDQWLPYIANLKDNVDLENYLNEALNRIITSHLEALRENLDVEIEEALLPLLRYAAAMCLDMGIDSELLRCLDINEFPTTMIDDLPQWESIAEFLLTKQNTLRKSFNANIGFPAPSDTKDKIEKLNRKVHKEKAVALVNNLSDNKVLLELLSDIRDLPSPVLSNQQHEVLKALGEILPILVAFLRVVFQESSKVDFIEVNLRALDALGDELSPTDITLSLDYQIHHILIDEYQDTSVSQFRLFEKLVMGWQVGDNRTLFLVGDPMQSIYRFRGAEVSLFLYTAQQGLGGVKLTPLTLSMNFRSTANIIDWINNTFVNIFPKESELALGGVTYSAANSPYTEQYEQAVHVHNHDCVISLIQKSLAENPQASIAVLVRAKRHLVGLVDQLKQANIDFIAHEIEQLAQRQHVVDILSLLKAVTNLTDITAWFAILRAPWLGLSLADLLAISQYQQKSILWEALSDFENISTLSQNAKTRLSCFVPIMKYWLSNQSRMPLKQFIRGLWIALGGPDCYRTANFQNDIDIIIHLIDTDVKSLESKLNELYGDITPQGQNTPQVELMTIHKAKGLEYDIVILPHLHRLIKSNDSSLLLWFERSHLDGIDLILAPRRSQKEEYDKLYRYVDKQIRKKNDFETARLLYVAATRAKKTLHLIGEPNAPAKSFFAMLNLVDPDQSIQTNDQNENTLLARHSIKRLPDDWKLPESIYTKLQQQLQRPEPIDRNLPESGDLLSKSAGTIFHRILQMHQTQNVKPQVIKLSLKRMGLTQEDLEQGVTLILQGLKNMISDPKGQWILDIHHHSRQSEWPLSLKTKQGIENYVIDYSFVDNQGTRWIIDYKLSLDKNIEPYRKQLEKYQYLLTKMDNRPVRCGLYFPLLSYWWEME